MNRVGVVVATGLTVFATACSGGSPARVPPARTSHPTSVTTPTDGATTETREIAFCAGASSGGHTEAVQATRETAGQHARTPLGAARQSRDSPRLSKPYRSGRILERPSTTTRPSWLYEVVVQGRPVARFTVRPIGAGAFAATTYVTCLP